MRIQPELNAKAKGEIEQILEEKQVNSPQADLKASLVRLGTLALLIFGAYKLLGGGK